jgi:hypothetical protein
MDLRPSAAFVFVGSGRELGVKSTLFGSVGTRNSNRSKLRNFDVQPALTRHPVRPLHSGLPD